MSPTTTPASAVGQKAEFGFVLPRPSAAQKARALKLLAQLRKDYPHAHCELVHANPHQLLVATILSAQATDASVNKATPGLFKAFPMPADYAKATPQKIEPYIKSIGLYRNKARSIHAAMSSLVTDFGGKVPQTMPELLTLRGVARKTAGVVLGNAFNINMNVVVDTHVHRLSQRLALAPQGANVQQTERWLMALFPRDAWCELSHLLIFHGRYTCKARGVQCCNHPVCCDFGQKCELRITARRRQSEPDTSAREARGSASASSSTHALIRKASSASLADASGSDKTADREKGSGKKKRPRKESNL